MPLILEKRRSILYLCILSVSLLLFSCFSLFPIGGADPPVLFPSPSTAPEKSSSSLSDHPSAQIKSSSYFSGPCDEMKNLGFLKVYMYDLPAKFHFGLLDWKGRDAQLWPDVAAGAVPRYPGGLNLQHSVEYWLTLDLLLPRRLRTTAVREMNSSTADVIFVPFFSSLSYNRRSKLRHREEPNEDLLLQDELVEFLLSREEWQRTGGRDHLIVAHHPNSLAEARRKLSAAMFVLADFARYPPDVANLGKDLVAPYKHVVRCATGDSSPFEARPVLLYFQGAIRRKDGGAVREQLYRLLRGEKDVHFAYGAAKGSGTRIAGRGMATSKFCLHIAGDTPSSNRLFDAIACRCVPVVVSDGIELPFEDEVDYAEFCVFVLGKEAVKKGFLLGLLRSVGKGEWTRRWERMNQVAGKFEYQFPSQAGDAVRTIWEAVARKLPAVRLGIHRAGRYRRSSGNAKVTFRVGRDINGGGNQNVSRDDGEDEGLSLYGKRTMNSSIA